MKALIYFFIFVFFISCSNDFDAIEISRYDKIPQNAKKIYPDTDKYPPIIHSNEWQEIVPMNDIINTAGCEDNAFIYDNLFLFFFTPNINNSIEEQLIDSITGIWYSIRENGEWNEPKRVWLDALRCIDKAPFFNEEIMWFNSIRDGNYGEGDIYYAAFSPYRWFGITNAGEYININCNVEELCINDNNDTMYFSKYDNNNYNIYMMIKMEDGKWGKPIILNFNSEKLNERNPFITKDSKQLWFSAESQLGYMGDAIYKCERIGEQWSAPIEIISNFVSSPVLDEDNNIYFTHYFYDDSLIESDIYIAIKNNKR